MVSIHPPNSNSFSLFSKLLGTVPSARITIGITITFMFHSFLRSFLDQVFVSLFVFFDFYSEDHWNSNVHKTVNSLFFFSFVNYHLVWSSGQDVICLYLKIPENFMSLILLDGFWFVPVPFYVITKFQFLVEFPVDHLSHPVMSSLILLLLYFVTFTYMIKRFISYHYIINSCYSVGYYWF